VTILDDILAHKREEVAVRRRVETLSPASVNRSPAYSRTVSSMR